MPEAKMDPEPESIAVGRQIRTLREMRQMTLKQLAERTGFSVSYLSLIETGHANHSLKILREIARVLDVPMIDFLAAEPGQEISVVRAADRRTYTFKTGAEESLLYRRHRFELQTTLMHLPPRTSSGEPSRHPGEENTLVLQGRIRVWVGASPPLDLDEGDIVYYLSSLPHRWENPFNTDARILITNTPATY
jgi:transcriptional regulator with XRE-family HTH domain